MTNPRGRFVYAAVAVGGVLLVAMAAQLIRAQTSPPPGPNWYLCHLNGDRAVDDQDLARFCEAWRKQHPAPPQEPQVDPEADFNISGRIDPQDAKAMVEYYLNAEAASAQRR